MLDVVSPVLHIKAPSALVEREDDPQLSTTVITGGRGVSFSTITTSPFISDMPDSLVPVTV